MGPVSGCGAGVDIDVKGVVEAGQRERAEESVEIKVEETHKGMPAQEKRGTGNASRWKRKRVRVRRTRAFYADTVRIYSMIFSKYASRIADVPPSRSNV